MEIEPGVTLRVETVSLDETARQEIQVAREEGLDPVVFVQTHRRIAASIERLLANGA